MKHTSLECIHRDGCVNAENCKVAGHCTLFRPATFSGIEKRITKQGERWDRHFLEKASNHSMMSKDPSTRVGAVIVGTGQAILSAGFNGFPCGIEETAARLNDREMKLKLMVHAEMNAVLAAARAGTRLDGSTLFLAATDHSGHLWGRPPCTRCLVEIIQTGIGEIVSYPIKSSSSRWHADLEFSKQLIQEAGIKYRELPLLETAATTAEIR